MKQNPMKFNIRPQIIIGIDPDVEASGMAVIDTTAGDGKPRIELTVLPLPELIDHIGTTVAAAGETPVRIFIEAGWLNKGNWHLNPRDNKQLAAAKGRQAGRNHQLGLDICALLDHRKIRHSETVPLIKCWKGKDRKITHEELDTIVRFVNGIGLPRKRSNQEERDALLLAWAHAGLPIRAQ